MLSKIKFIKLKISVPEYIERWALIDFLGAIAGIIGGLGAIVFRLMINFNRYLFYNLIAKALNLNFNGYNLSIPIITCIGGLIVGLIVTKFAFEAKGHGVPEVMEAIYLHGGVIRRRVALVKIIASSITIGSGGSAGREGPIAQIGASMGSTLGQIFRLSSREVRLLTICGLSAGIAGTFNAPLGGALFGLEVLYRGIEPFDAIPIIIAVTLGTAIATWYLGSQPAFRVFGLTFNNPIELVFYILLGIIFGFISVFWVKLFYSFERFFDGIKIRNEVKPAIGALIAGLIGMLFPTYGILGVGYEGIEMALTGLIPSTLLLVLGLIKMISTSLTIGSGGSGGIFAPSLYIGCMLGGFLGIIFKSIAPSIVLQPYTYCLAGMAALFAGAAQAPLTVIIMVPEMCANYSLLLPIMISSSISYFIAWMFMRGSSIYTLKLERRGVHIKVGRPEILDFIQVKEVMSRKVITVKANMPASLLEILVIETGHVGFPVIEDNKLIGFITIEDLRKVKPEELNKVKIKDLASKKLIVAYPDESLSSVLTKMYKYNVGRLPVVDRKDKSKLLGIISKTDILIAYKKFKET